MINAHPSPVTDTLPITIEPIKIECNDSIDCGSSKYTIIGSTTMKTITTKKISIEPKIYLVKRFFSGSNL